VGSFKDRFIESEILRAEEKAVTDGDFSPILGVAKKDKNHQDHILQHAMAQNPADPFLPILYCLALAQVNPEISRQILGRVLSAAPDCLSGKVLNDDEVRILGNVTRTDASLYSRFANALDFNRLTLVQPGRDDETYPIWLGRWLPNEVHRLEADCDATALAALMREHSEAESIAETRAASLSTDAWRTWVYADAFARNGSEACIPLLKSLVDLPDEAVAWDYLQEDDLKPLGQFVLPNARSLFERLVAKLNDEQFKLTCPQDSTSDDYVFWAKLGLGRGILWTELSENLRRLSLTWPEPKDIFDSLRIASPSQLAGDVASNLFTSLQSGNTTSPRVEGLLRELFQLLLYDGDLAVDESLLSAVAAHLGEMTFQACAPAAGILRRQASRDWVPGLKQAWHRVESVSRQSQEDPYRPIVPDLVLASFAVATALGECAARDTSLRSLARDRKILSSARALEGELQPLRGAYNNLVREYKQIVMPEEIQGVPEEVRRRLEQAGRWSEAIHAPRRLQIEAELKETKVEMMRLERALQRELDAVRDGLSPAHLMLGVLNHGQNYDVGIRQAAAMGLELLAGNGHLNDSGRATIDAAIRAACAGEEGQQFRERRMLVPLNCNRIELINAVREALQWVEDIVDEAVHPNSASADPATFKPDSIDMLFRHIPGILKFLERYPLRFMRREDHLNLLGQYARSGGEVETWVRFEPPKGVGRVKQRFWALNERSTPNSMGIDHRLFRHPGLLLPTLFHEYLHHAGVSENGNAPIPNETEVRFREALFTRGLIAAMAPEDDSQLQDFEISILEALKGTDMDFVLFLLLSDLWDPAVVERVNFLIYNTYEGGGDHDLAKRRVEAEISELTVGTYIRNLTQIWDPDIKWPLPGSEGTEDLFAQFRNLRLQREIQINTVKLNDLPGILLGRSSQQDREAWDRYCRRPGSLRVLRAAFMERPFAGETWLDLMRGAPA